MQTVRGADRDEIDALPFRQSPLGIRHCHEIRINPLGSQIQIPSAFERFLAVGSEHSGDQFDSAVHAGRDPVDLLRQANGWKFNGCIILNISAVGTESGLDPAMLASMRAAYHRKLFWGGGVATPDDLSRLKDAGFDGAIIATALHHGKVPLDWIRRGRVC